MNKLLVVILALVALQVSADDKADSIAWVKSIPNYREVGPRIDSLLIKDLSTRWSKLSTAVSFSSTDITNELMYKDNQKKKQKLVLEQFVQSREFLSQNESAVLDPILLSAVIEIKSEKSDYASLSDRQVVEAIYASGILAGYEGPELLQLMQSKLN